MPANRDTFAWLLKRIHVRSGRTFDVWCSILNRDPCSYCGAPAAVGARSTVDHITPTSAGGERKQWINLTAACAKCNREKEDFSLLRFYLLRARLRHRRIRDATFGFKLGATARWRE